MGEAGLSADHSRPVDFLRIRHLLSARHLPALRCSQARLRSLELQAPIAVAVQGGMGEQFVKDHFVEFGQGVQSKSPALRDLEQALLEAGLAHGNHPVLTMCVANTVITVTARNP